MGRFTPEELARKAPGRSPQELADLDMTDGEWERKGAEIKAAHAQSVHDLEMAKAAGLHEVNNLRFAPEVVALANYTRGEQLPDDKQGLDEIIEDIIEPYRVEYLASFDAPTPVTIHKIGLNESAFLKLLGGK